MREPSTEFDSEIIIASPKIRDITVKIDSVHVQPDGADPFRFKVRSGRRYVEVFTRNLLLRGAAKIAECKEGDSETVVCSSWAPVNADVGYPGVITDPRDDESYEIVRLWNIEWFAQNLRLKGKFGGRPPKNDEKLAESYGRLYQGKFAGSLSPLAPPGWRMPGVEDFEVLFGLYGDSAGVFGRAFKETVEGGRSGLNIRLAGVFDRMEPSGREYLYFDEQGLLWTAEIGTHFTWINKSMKVTRATSIDPRATERLMSYRFVRNCETPWDDYYLQGPKVPADQ